MSRKNPISTASAGHIMGKRGGSATGPCKVRGDSEYYRKIALKSAAVRRANAKKAAKQQKAAGRT